MTTYTTTIAKQVSREIDWTKLPANAQDKIIAYGVQRIFNDMIGGNERFPTLKDKVAHVDAQIARFMAGDIGRMRTESVPTETAIARQLVRKALKDQLGAKSEKWSTFTGLSDDDQVAKLDAIYEKNTAKFEPAVKEEMKLRAAKAAAAKKLSGAMEIDF